MIDLSKLSGRYHIRPMEAADAEAILALCRENTLYYQYCGMEPTLEQVLSDLRVAPPGIGPEDKHYVGFCEGGSLAAVMDLLRQHGARVVNTDLTIVAQRPKLAPYIPAMREKLAGAMGVAPDRVSVKATTTERLGFEGHCEGISAQAVCLLQING